MAEIFRYVNGDPIQHWLAEQKFVQAHLFGRAHDMRMKASMALAAHRHAGHAFIEIEHGRIDYHIILNDQRGQKAAMSIEFGRSPDEFGRGGMEGLRILHNATGLGGA